MRRYKKLRVTKWIFIGIAAAAIASLLQEIGVAMSGAMVQLGLCALDNSLCILRNYGILAVALIIVWLIIDAVVNNSKNKRKPKSGFIKTIYSRVAKRISSIFGKSNKAIRAESVFPQPSTDTVNPTDPGEKDEKIKLIPKTWAPAYTTDPGEYEAWIIVENNNEDVDFEEVYAVLDQVWLPDNEKGWVPWKNNINTYSHLTWPEYDGQDYITIKPDDKARLDIARSQNRGLIKLIFQSDEVLADKEMWWVYIEVSVRGRIKGKYIKSKVFKGQLSIEISGRCFSLREGDMR